MTTVQPRVDPLTARSPALTPVAVLNFTASDLSGVRDAVHRFALANGLVHGRRLDLVIAANEVATNSLRHGAGDGTLRLWRHETTLLCEITDGGNAAPDRLSPRGRQPEADANGGFGMWIVRQLCDDVEVRTLAGGTIVRLAMSL